MWTQLIDMAKKRMGHSAQASKRQQNLIDQMQQKEKEELSNTYSTKPLGAAKYANNQTTP